MFDNLTTHLSQAIRNLTGAGQLNEKNIKDALREVRVALLSADVALEVVNDFMATIEARAIGQQVGISLTPGQTLIKIVHEALIELMGDTVTTLNLNTQQPAIILVAGLQGSGKTTTVAKLARKLIEEDKMQVMVCSADVYRPAAILQLATLATEVKAQFFPSDASDKPVAIAKDAIQEAKRKSVDVVIIDTAGRLHIDDDMMAEIKNIHATINPIETLFVVDSMAGQDAARSAKAFHQALPLTGVVLTKVDGDAQGGCALSVRAITGKPIKFIGVGEKMHALEPFHPDRIASRILGMGDILSLIEETQRTVDQKKAQKLAKKMRKGHFDLEDFAGQLKQMQSMGGMTSLLEKLPGDMAKMANTSTLPDKEITKMTAMINSMTKQERRFPALIKGSRKRRIAGGSGTQIQDVNRLLKQFSQMQKMIKKMHSKGGLRKMMQSMQQMMGQGGGFPGNF